VTEVRAADIPVYLSNTERVRQAFDWSPACAPEPIVTQDCTVGLRARFRTRGGPPARRIAAKPRGAGAGRAGPRSRRDRQARDRGSRELRERWIPLLKVVGEQQGVTGGLVSADYLQSREDNPQQPSRVPSKGCEWPALSARGGETTGSPGTKFCPT